MKIRVKNQDFIVDEVANFCLQKSGRFRLYLLSKEGWATVDAIKELSRKSGIPFSAFAWGGRKDRHSLSTQYITVRDSKSLAPNSKGLSVKLIGYLNRPMGPGLIIANDFKITIRDLNRQETDLLTREMEKVVRFGFCNYFDDQRFGGYSPQLGFLGEKVLKGHFNGALKIYLCFIAAKDKKDTRMRKSLFFDNWGDWQFCLKRAKTDFEKISFDHLAKNHKDFITLLKKIPKDELSFAFSSYQSFLWNNMLFKLIKERVGPPARLIHEGCAGDYLFLDQITLENIEFFKRLKIPLPSAKAKFTDEGLKTIYSDILKQNGLKQGMFNRNKIRQAYFGEALRDALIFPENLEFVFGQDELDNQKLKCSLSFRLRRGSFATMLIKRIFAKKYTGPD
jgi:tRNA pseudouridine13 synthase